jgi:predicted permease
MQGFIPVATQVLILFLLMGVGILCKKCKILNITAVKCISDIVLYCVTPCVIIRSFADTPFNAEKLKALLLTLLITLLIHGGMILLSRLLVRDTDDSRQRMLQFAVIFSNVGYMGLPLQEALLGSEGTFYSGMYIAVFNAAMWTYGLYLMSGDKTAVSPKKALLSPGVLGVLVGFAVFLMPFIIPSFTLPHVLYSPIHHLANLNTPLPMLVIGFYLADIDFKAIFKDKKCFYVIFLRLMVMPLLALGILYICGVRGVMLISLIISVSTPIAAVTTMFSTKYDRYPNVSCNLVSLSTLLSILTMPLIVSLAGLIA